MPRPQYDKKEECAEDDHHVRTAYLKNGMGTIKVDYCTKCDKIIHNYGYIS